MCVAKERVRLMNYTTFNLKEKEMRDLAEICSMALDMIAAAPPEGRSVETERWRRLCCRFLEAAHSVPSIGKDMELNPDSACWCFRRSYLENAFFEDVVDEYRDACFWSELVTRMSEHALAEVAGEEAVERMSEEERRFRCSALEKALWNECTHHGLDRLVFMLPESES